MAAMRRRKRWAPVRQWRRGARAHGARGSELVGFSRLQPGMGEGGGNSCGPGRGRPLPGGGGAFAGARAEPGARSWGWGERWRDGAQAHARRTPRRQVGAGAAWQTVRQKVNPKAGGAFSAVFGACAGAGFWRWGPGATGVISVVLANAPRLRGTATSGGELGRGQRRDYCSCALRPHLSCATHTLHAQIMKSTEKRRERGSPP